jgi:hypothetical protein
MSGSPVSGAGSAAYAGPSGSPPPPGVGPHTPLWAANLNTTRPPRPKRRGLAAPLIVVAVVVLVCSGVGVGTWKLAGNMFGDNSGQNPAATRGPNIAGGATAGPVVNDVPQGNGQAQSLPMDKTIWYAGYKIQFTKVSYDPAKKNFDGQLSADVTITNLSTEQVNYPIIPINYSEGNTHFPGRINGTTALPGAAPTNARFDFMVNDHKPNLAAGRFTIGEAAEDQAVVPVDSKATGFVALEPKKIVEATKFTIGQIEFIIHGCELRSSFENDHKQHDKDTVGVWCGHDIHNTKADTRFIESQNYRLKLPDGTVVAPAKVKTTLVQKINQQETNLSVQWSIPAPPKGEYVLQFCDLGRYADEAVTPANTHEIKVTLG